jgi:hypothetical protein
LPDQVATALKALDAALLQNPDDSTAWFLRAFCYLILQDEVRMERDLRRMLEIEEDRAGGGGTQTSLRLQRIEPLQGEARRRLATSTAKVLKAILANKPPLTVGGSP